MWQRGVLARMVIKNDKVRLGLWKLRFQDGLSPKECVDRLTDAKVQGVVQDADLRDAPRVRRRRVVAVYNAQAQAQRAGVRRRTHCGGAQMFESAHQRGSKSAVLATARDNGAQANVRLSTTQIGIAVNTGVKEHGLGYSHKLKQFVAGEKDHESRVAFLKYISLLLPAWDENWHKVVFFDGNASLPPRSDSLYQPLIGRTAIKRLLAP